MRTTVNHGTVEDQLALERLVYQYAIALDSLDKPALEACFAPGALSSGQADRVIEYHRKYEHTMHNVINHLHGVRGDAASGVTYCVASMVTSNDGKLTKFDVYFMYREELVKLQGQWLFSKREGEMIFSTDMMPVQPGASLLGLRGLDKPGSFRARPALAAMMSSF